MTNELFEFEILKASRTRLFQLIESVDSKILFKIPENFNNNIVWQIGHCITSQQRHMYMRSGLPMHISQEFMETFKIGTSPHTWKSTYGFQERAELHDKIPTGGKSFKRAQT